MVLLCLFIGLLFLGIWLMGKRSANGERKEAFQSQQDLICRRFIILDMANICEYVLVDKIWWTIGPSWSIAGLLVYLRLFVISQSNKWRCGRKNHVFIPLCSNLIHRWTRRMFAYWRKPLLFGRRNWNVMTKYPNTSNIYSFRLDCEWDFCGLLSAILSPYFHRLCLNIE